MRRMNLIDINGVRLEVRHIAAPAPCCTTPLVFLHEGLGSVSLWRDWPEQLCALTQRPGLVYSRQGYGQSDPRPDVRGQPRELDNGQRSGHLLPDYLHREAWDVLPALLAQQGIAAPVLVGHSDGGTIALLYASRHPVAACIVLAPHVMVEALSVQAIAETRDTYTDSSSGLRQRLARHHADVDCAFWQWNDVWLSQAFRTFDIREDCRRISAPLLAIQGEGDPYGSMAQIDDIAACAPQAQLLKLPNCGHVPHREQSEAVQTAIQAFLQQTCAPCDAP
jgi:pimeloyl-ACP methyl ester carboxylesterase